MILIRAFCLKEKTVTHPWTSVWRVSPWFSVVSLNLRLRFTRIITDCVTDGFVTSFFVWKEKTVTHPWTSVWRVVSMIRSSVPLSEITFHTDYHGLCHGWICYERFYVRKKRNPWLIRGHPCEELSPWFSVVCFNLRLRFTRIITEWVTDGFATSFLSERENLDSSVDIRVKRCLHDSQPNRM